MVPGHTLMFSSFYHVFVLIKILIIAYKMFNMQLCLIYKAYIYEYRLSGVRASTVF